MSKVFLKHFFRVNRFLLPRYIFHSTVATFFLAGWMLLYILVPEAFGFIPYSPALQISFIYGVTINAILAGLF